MTLSKKRFSIYISYTHTFHLIIYSLPKAILSIGISQKNKLSQKKEQNRLVIIKKSITFALAFEKETTFIVSLSQAN